MMPLFGFFLLFASWLQPMHLPPWVSWHSEVLAFAAMLCLAWSMTSACVGRGMGVFPVLPATTIPLLLLGVWIAVQWASGLIPFTGDVVVYWAYLALCIAGMTVGYFSGQQRPQWIEGLAWTILAGAFASAVIALMQALDLSSAYSWINETPGLRRPGANLGQPNQLATLLVLGLASQLLLVESGKLGRAAAYLMALILVTSIAATESRAGVLGIFALGLWWIAKRKTIGAEISPWFAASIGMFYLICYWMWPIWMAEVYQIPGGTLPPNTVAYSRLAIWKQLLQAVMLRPWWGWGFGQISAAHNAVVDQYPTSEAYTYAHNIILDLALGLGLPLAAVILAAVGAWAWARMRKVNELSSWYCVAVVIPVATHSLVEFPFAYAYFLIPVMFSVGTLGALLGEERKAVLRPIFVRVALIAMSALLVWSTAEYLSIEEDFRVVRFEALHVGQTPLDYKRPNVQVFTQLDALLHGGRVVPRPKMLAEEVELAKTVALRYPWIATQNRYALALALNGNSVEAIRQLRVMRAQHGEKKYKAIKKAWAKLAADQYPQLLEINIP